MSRFDQSPEHQVAVQALRAAGYADASPLPPLPPLGWERINLMGDCNWQQNKQVGQGDLAGESTVIVVIVDTGRVPLVSGTAVYEKNARVRATLEWMAAL